MVQKLFADSEFVKIPFRSVISFVHGEEGECEAVEDGEEEEAYAGTKGGGDGPDEGNELECEWLKR